MPPIATLLIEQKICKNNKLISIKYFKDNSKRKKNVIFSIIRFIFYIFIEVVIIQINIWLKITIFNLKKKREKKCMRIRKDLFFFD